MALLNGSLLHLRSLLRVVEGRVGRVGIAGRRWGALGKLLVLMLLLLLLLLLLLMLLLRLRLCLYLRLLVLLLLDVWRDQIRASPTNVARVLLCPR